MTSPNKCRPWTATDVYKLKGLAKKNVEISKIARMLKRSPDVTIEKARQLNIVLNLESSVDDSVGPCASFDVSHHDQAIVANRQLATVADD